MDILRYGHDSYEQVIVDGVSWDLLGLAVGAGLAVILIHAIYRQLRRKRGG